jgi:DNA-binding MarR family transcriptional regulator
MNTDLHIRELVNRLARLDAASAWGSDLNPTQRAVLDYLGRANRFSRSPSHVADYLGSTRGTVSQSFKSLVQKGYVSERRSEFDKRAISFDLTEKGLDVVKAGSPLTDVLAGCSSDQKDAVLTALQQVLGGVLSQNAGRAFGVCANCVHHVSRPLGGFCSLLSEPLTQSETTQICHEYTSR